MTIKEKISRRSFLALASAVPFVPAAMKGKRPPVGLELFSVRDQLKQDLPGTLRAVAKMGYAGVEFFSPYFDWTPEYAKEVRSCLMISTSVATRPTTAAAPSRPKTSPTPSHSTRSSAASTS